MLDEVEQADAPVGELVVFVTAGAPAAGVFHCSGCAYGVVVQSTLPLCPMCGGTTWERVP